jgi:hypothetical protein
MAGLNRIRVSLRIEFGGRVGCRRWIELSQGDLDEAAMHGLEAERSSTPVRLGISGPSKAGVPSKAKGKGRQGTISLPALPAFLACQGKSGYR